MEDTLKNEVLEVVKELNALHADKVMAFYTGDRCSWSEYLLIATAGSQTHLQGIARNLRPKLEELKWEQKPGSIRNENNWILLDCHNVVINIMTKEAREYYELEKIWFDSPCVYGDQSSSSS